MRILFSEYKSDYTTYTFPYTVFCVKESQDELSEIYEKGFLPYTGDISISKDIFYLARSLRINLDNFSDTSENRRVHRKMRNLHIDIQAFEKKRFNWENPDFWTFCGHYIEERFQEGVMDRQRLEYIISRGTLTHILTFRSESKVYGYVFASIHEKMLHYWYAFFDVNYLETRAIGKWMMWRTIKWAQDNGMKYVYLGTCYRCKSLYKVRDHKGAEFFDGNRWNKDLALLKKLCKKDDGICFEN